MEEGIALDPKEFCPERVELSLHELGLEVRADGADWAEADIAAQFARQSIGAAVTDRHLEPVEMTIPIMVKEEGSVSLAEAAQRLEAKIGLAQFESGGWIRRDFDDAGGFAGSVGYQVLKMSISGLDGWLFAHRQHAEEVTLKILRGPLCYATTEIESKVFTETAKRELIWELSEVLGTAPGLIRVLVTNTGAADWRALESCIELRDYTKGATAEPVYACVALTPKGGAAEATREGEKVVRHTGLTAGWLTILDSKIAASGYMTHRGVRRLKLRIFDPGSEAGNVQLRLRWRSLGTLQWSENRIAPTPLVSDWSIVDLGEARPEQAAVGGERWEWQLQARAVNGAGSIDLARVRIYPTEQMAVVRAPFVAPAADMQSVKSPGEAFSEAGGVLTTAWLNAENVKVSDASRATVSLTPGKPQSALLVAKKFGFAIPEAATIVGIVVSVQCSTASGSTRERNVRLIGGTANLSTESPLPTEEAYRSYGSSAELWGGAWTPTVINATTFGVLFAVEINGSGVSPTVSVNHIKANVYYTEAVDENRVCFASRSVELRTDDIVRQHPSEDVWGRIVPEGFLPYAPPSGLEGRSARGIIAPSQGDLGMQADSGSNKLSAVVSYRPGYLFAREAL